MELDELKKLKPEELDKLASLSPSELVDLGICPTCLNKITNSKLYGDESPQTLYTDKDITCMLVTNPRAAGHMIISSVSHYHDMSEAPISLNEKMIRFSKEFMNIICKVYGCERVYLCTMCDGPNNHYHLQLIPRYSFEKRGSTNFVKPRIEYVEDKEKIEKMRKMIAEFASKDEKSNEDQPAL